MSRAVPEFGLAAAGKTYVLREGSYGIIRNESGFIAVVLTLKGAFLPGGGQEPGESTKRALIREVTEECGLAIRAIEFLGMADELVFSPEEQTYFRKRCSFFIAEDQSHSGSTTVGT